MLEFSSKRKRFYTTVLVPTADLRWGGVLFVAGKPYGSIGGTLKGHTVWDGSTGRPALFPRSAPHQLLTNQEWAAAGNKRLTRHDYNPPATPTE